MDGNQPIGQPGFSINNLLSFRNIVVTLIVFIFINLVVLDAGFLQDKILGVSKETPSSSQSTQVVVNKPVATTIITPTLVPTISGTQAVCAQPCIVQISAAEARVNKSIASLKLTPAPAKTVAAATPTPVVAQSTSVKEFYIPFGTGTSTAADWQGVAGAQANINSAAYPNIKSVTFEVSLHIPNANQVVNVRLYNATDGRAIANSDLTFSSNGSSILNVSPNIILDSGNKLYQVQIKTQLQSSAVLDQARVHITLQ